MPYGEVKLVPGVNVERTPTLLEAGISQSQLVRFKDSLVQKYGGWLKYFGFAIAGTPRDLHAWQDLNATTHLLVGTTSQLTIITSGATTTITPQQTTTNPVVNFSAVLGSAEITITDPGISTVTTFDAISLNVPVSIAGLVLFGVYQISTVTGVTSYKIIASANANATTSTAVIPVFTTTSGSSTVSVNLTAHQVMAGNRVVFQATTTGQGVTVFGQYTVASVSDANNFTIVVSNQASGNGSFSMNSGNAQILYYINLGPAAIGSGYGLGAYGAGGYGTGTVSSVQAGTPITATDWTSDNWGQIILACPSGGGVYQFDPTGGYTNAGLVSTAPSLNGGIFVSNSLQILFCWGSTQTQTIGIERDPMLISWSDLGDYTSFIPKTTNQAGSFRIPIGSVIRGGMAVSQQNLFWTDLDLWASNYCGFPLVFGFNKIGSGAGAISSHAMQQLRNGIYWMGPTNFYSYSGDGVKVLPCPVWDAVFQNLNTTYAANVRAMPNTPFNEAGWLFPSTASTSGECDSYVKMNITEPGQPWDYGLLSRSAWIDQTVLGFPVSATPTGLVYQHETSPDADGAPLMSSFTTGYFYLDEGQEFAIVDQVIPDMKWGVFGGSSGAQVFISFNTINYPGDTPTTYGPYLLQSSTEYITVRFRNRQMSVTLASTDVGSFWRLGKIRYRYQKGGRR